MDVKYIFVVFMLYIQIYKLKGYLYFFKRDGGGFFLIVCFFECEGL